MDILIEIGLEIIRSIMMKNWLNHCTSNKSRILTRSIYLLYPNEQEGSH